MTPRYAPLLELTRARVREFYREPAAVFWVYGFPMIMAVALGIAFREQPVVRLAVDLVENEVPTQAALLREQLQADGRFDLRVVEHSAWRKRLRDGKTSLVIVLKADPQNRYEVWHEPHRTESLLAHSVFQNVLLREAGCQPQLPASSNELRESGSRYIDFLIPGLLGTNLMGGGLFGVGFVIVDMRVRKLLKRFLATPLRRSHFLLSVMISRMLFTVPEILFLLGFAWLAFGVKVSGSWLLLLAVILLGGFCFAGIGLLVACRAKTIETASGLLNLVMLPMYMLSGVFFSADRFPDEIQPAIRILPLTAINDALRGVMLEAHSLAVLWPQFVIMTAWGAVSFAVALWIFRWK
jgi:ABC-type multidrug transport system permease subunit